jgi:hypothetical protein
MLRDFGENIDTFLRWAILDGFRVSNDKVYFFDRFDTVFSPGNRKVTTSRTPFRGLKGSFF